MGSHPAQPASKGSDPVTVQGRYEMGTQDPAFLGPESGLAVPVGDGGVELVELYVSTQDLHRSQRQVADCLGLPFDKVARR